MESLAGQFLLASPDLRDPNFAGTVVLIIRHDQDGAFGLILNKPTEFSVDEGCGEDVEAARGVSDLLHRGGPCSGPLFCVHALPGMDESDSVVPGVFFTANRATIERILADGSRPARFVVGYSGWGPGQLEGELEQGGWLTLPATKEHVFADIDGLWEKLLRIARLSKYVKPELIPDDPRVN